MARSGRRPRVAADQEDSLHRDDRAPTARRAAPRRSRRQELRGLRRGRRPAAVDLDCDPARGDPEASEEVGLDGARRGDRERLHAFGQPPGSTGRQARPGDVAVVLRAERAHGDAWPGWAKDDTGAAPPRGSSLFRADDRVTRGRARWRLHRLAPRAPRQGGAPVACQPLRGRGRRRGRSSR